MVAMDQDTYQQPHTALPCILQQGMLSYHGALFDSCNMSTSDLPDMYAQSLRAEGNISGKLRVPMLQLLCNTFLASCAQAKSSVELQQLYL